MQERSEKEERNKESREALDKQEKLSQTGPGGSKMRPRSFQNHPGRSLGRPRVPSERSGGDFGQLLGLSRDAPERSWAPLGYLAGCLGVQFGALGDDFRAPKQSAKRKERKA